MTTAALLKKLDREIKATEAAQERWLAVQDRLRALQGELRSERERLFGAK
jgi:hypothetical protein